MTKKKLAIVAVETNLVGRMALPKRPFGEDEHWPFEGREKRSDDQAEIVAAFVSDLDEAGAIKFVLRGVTTGILREVYPVGFRVNDE